jgi:hypothetical protein
VKEYYKQRLLGVSRKPVELSPAKNFSSCPECISLIEDGVKKFATAIDQKAKYTILTSMPKRMSRKETIDAFGCSQYLAREAVKLKWEGGAFTFPVPKKRPEYLSQKERDEIVAFYENSMYSRTSPDKRDVKPIKDKESGGWVLKAKIRLTLTFQFKLVHPEIKIGEIIFYLMKPVYCSWPKNHMYHRQCTCEIHDNFSLLMVALCREDGLKYILENVPCDKTREKYMLGICPECPVKDKITDLFLNIRDLQEVEFHQWTNSDGCELMQYREATSDFKERVKRSIPNILKHHFYVKKQNEFVTSWKEEGDSHPAEALVTVDFAQNYAFRVPDEVQS